MIDLEKSKYSGKLIEDFVSSIIKEMDGCNTEYILYKALSHILISLCVYHPEAYIHIKEKMEEYI